MYMPTYEDCMLPFLKVLSDGQLHTIRDIIEDVSRAMRLDEQQRVAMLTSGARVIANRVGWARTYLKKAGLLQSPKRGIMQITDRGNQVLAENPVRVDAAFLKERFPEFREWIQAKPPKELATDGEAATPDETMDAAHKELLDQTWPRYCLRPSKTLGRNSWT
jgi:restriction system protein